MHLSRRTFMQQVVAAVAGGAIGRQLQAKTPSRRAGQVVAAAAGAAIGRRLHAKTPSPSAEPAARPNVVVILADDLGWGDLNCYNPDGMIPTPNLDVLARQGMRFTDAHTPAAQCSPTRYGLMTGRYAWRTRMKTGVLQHFARPLIAKKRLTLASLLKRHGYATAGIGKWHLGLGWQTKPGQTIKPTSWDARQVDKIDFTKPLTAGPLDHGFDYYFGIGCYIEGHRVVQPPTTQRKSPVYDTETGVGLVSPDYVSEQIDQVLWTKAKSWLDKHFKTTPDKPFFLYLPTSAIHRPCLAVKAFRNKSKAGLHGDKVVELDDIVGKLMAMLKAKGCQDNTLVIFTSDNGAMPGDPERALQHYARHDWGKRWDARKLLARKNEGTFRNWLTYGHKVNGPYLGYKTTIYEGGHRVPFIVRWPGKVKAGSVSDEIICVVDVLATVAEILEVDLPKNAAEDSYSILPVLLGRKLNAPLREATIMTPWSTMKSVRQGPWKLIMGPDAGGFRMGRKVKTAGQLYNLAADPGETTNLYDRHPEKVKALTAIYEKYAAAGRSAPPAKFAR